jgi:hypothetical protein
VTAQSQAGTGVVGAGVVDLRGWPDADKIRVSEIEGVRVKIGFLKYSKSKFYMTPALVVDGVVKVVGKVPSVADLKLFLK